MALELLGRLPQDAAVDMRSALADDDVGCERLDAIS